MPRLEDPSVPAARPSATDADAAFHAAMAHLYRGEVHRMTVWRSRLDATSHWAMLLTVGMTTFALGAAGVPHFILLLGLALNTICMVIEARRYQYLYQSEWRLTLLERGYFARLLDGEELESGWRERLAADLRRPCARLSAFAAMRIRLRRNYLMLLLFVTAVWVTKVFIHPVSARSAGELYSRLAVADAIPSWFVAASACLFVVLSSALALTRSPDSLEQCPEEPSR
jgi:uncharacterized membrane protein